MSTIATRLKEKRKQKKLTQEYVANRLGISRVAYTYYENDKSEPSIEALITLANIYETSVDYLVGRYN